LGSNLLKLYSAEPQTGKYLEFRITEAFSDMNGKAAVQKKYDNDQNILPQNSNQPLSATQKKTFYITQ
jgi:hypothetical protein